MIYRFQPGRGMIVLDAVLHGPLGFRTVRLALDTGATSTVLNALPLAILGYDLERSNNVVQFSTGSRTESAIRVPISLISALGVEVSDLSVICHTLPPNVMVDGLIGLDFFRDRRLCIDFAAGEIELT